MPSCGAETHLFFSHLAIDASDTTSASRTWGPCRPASPIAPSEASYEGRNELEECLDNDGRSVASTVCVTNGTERYDLAFFASHFRGRVRLLKKSTTWSPAYINETETPASFLSNKFPFPRDKKTSTGGVVSAWGRCKAGPAAPKPMAPSNDATFLWRHAADRRFGAAVDNTRRCRHL